MFLKTIRRFLRAPYLRPLTRRASLLKSPLHIPPPRQQASVSCATDDATQEAMCQPHQFLRRSNRTLLPIVPIRTAQGAKNFERCKKRSDYGNLFPGNESTSGRRQFLSAHYRNVASITMISKCMNPSCSTPFRHLADGRLFQLQNDAPAAVSSVIEYFWLCSRCSAVMTLRIARNGKVVTTGLPETQNDGRVALDAENHRVLRAVRFLRTTHPIGT